MINIYAIQIVLILFFAFLFRNDKKKFLIATFIVLFVVMAFRNARIVGNDSATSYFGEFSAVQNAKLEWPNPGFPLLMKTIRLFTADYQWVIIVTALWVCFAYYKLLVKYSENAFISVMWFMGMLFYTFLFSALKQAWAMAFLCFAFDAIFEKKPFRFIVFIGLAVVFHFPALIFLPAYWIAKLRINRMFPILMFSILVVVFVFRSRILDLMVSAYSKGEVDYSSNVRFIGTKFIFMALMLAYGFYQYFKVKSDADSETDCYSALLYFMGIAAVMQTFCFYNNVFERLADYYYHFSILFVPLILTRRSFDSSNTIKSYVAPMNSLPNSSGTLSKKSIKNMTIEDIDINTVLIVIVSIFCIWRFLSVVNRDTSPLNPFFFFWQG